MLTCDTDSLVNIVANDFYQVADLDVPRKVGETLAVTCKDDWKLFTMDQWDSDPDDNQLTLMCKPDERFDVPQSSELPKCLARCSATKPQPRSSDRLILDTDKTPDGETWELELIWYKCENSEDGLEVIGPEGDPEGSDTSERYYMCSGSGDYDVEVVNGQIKFQPCLPRRKLFLVKCSSRDNSLYRLQPLVASASAT